LIPRPETELIVEAALERFPAEASIRAADVGTGSGCLAVALARERARARVTATDISARALEIAAVNARRLGVEDRVTCRRGDLLDGVDAHERFDLIVSNPPYVPDGERAALQPEVREFEPADALFAGADGLAVIRRLIPEAAARLARHGWLIFEIGQGQASAVADLVRATPSLGPVAFKPDLQRIPRTAIAQRVR
jgi:release factor glutamine methyltransferase